MDYKDMNAIGIVRLMLTDGVITEEQAAKYFPELKESWEDERIIKAIKSAVLQLTDIYLQEKYGLKQSDCIAWLEKQGEKKPWSEEDEEYFDDIVRTLRSFVITGGSEAKRYTEEEIDWLKSLRPQSHWKPSENELEVLRLAAEKDGACLMGLYEQLKKL